MSRANKQTRGAGVYHDTRTCSVSLRFSFRSSHGVRDHLDGCFLFSAQLVCFSSSSSSSICQHQVVEMAPKSTAVSSNRFLLVPIPSGLLVVSYVLEAGRWTAPLSSMPPPRSRFLAFTFMVLTPSLVGFLTRLSLWGALVATNGSNPPKL